jgi:hypothetical protein
LSIWWLLLEVAVVISVVVEAVLVVLEPELGYL